MAKDKDDFRVLNKLDLKVDQLNLTEDFRGRTAPVDDDAVVELADSMRSQGQLQPIQVRESKEKPGLYDVLFGNTRTLAAKKIVEGYRTLDGNRKPKDIPADPNFRLRAEVVDATDEQAFKRNVVENAQRNQTTVIDTMYNQAKLRDEHGMTDVAIAKLYGWPDSSAVNKIKGLLKLPKNVHERLHRGDIPVSAGYSLSTAKDVLESENPEAEFDKIFQYAEQTGDGKRNAPSLNNQETSYTAMDIALGIKKWREERSKAAAEANKPTEGQTGGEGTPGTDEGNGQQTGNGESGTPAVTRIPKTLKQFKDFTSKITDDGATPPKTREVFVIIGSFLKDELTEEQTSEAIRNLFGEYPLTPPVIEGSTEGVEEPGHVKVHPGTPDETSADPHSPEGAGVNSPEPGSQEPAVPQPEPAPAELPPAMEPAPASDDPQAPKEGTPQAPVPANEPQAPKPVQKPNNRRVVRKL